MKSLRVLFRNLTGDCFQFLELCCYRRDKESSRFGHVCTPQLQGQWTAFRMLCAVPSLNAELQPSPQQLGCYNTNNV
jgi:hypothetical protein